MNDPQAISDLISKLAISYDPNFEAEGHQLRAFLQGNLSGYSMSPEGLRKYLKVDSVDVPMDANGDYMNYFVVQTEAGHKLRVTVELDN